VDGTVKAALVARDGARIESVLIPEDDRMTLCVSTQVGCAMACSFCATGFMGFARNLRAAEIVDQVCRMRALAPADQPISNVVFMGMGEPLLNLEAVVEAIRLVIDPKAFAIAPRRVTVSTVGLVPKIGELLERVPVNLAVSLHATTDAVRDQLVPLNRRYPLAELLGALRAMPQVTPRRPVFFEYTLIAGVTTASRTPTGCPVCCTDPVEAESDSDESAPRQPAASAGRRRDRSLPRGAVPARHDRYTASQPRPRHPGGVRPARAAAGLTIGAQPPRRGLRLLYAVGDIHGERERLAALLAALPLQPDDRIVFVGDYVDRGPDAKGVVDLLLSLADDYACVFLAGTTSRCSSTSSAGGTRPTSRAMRSSPTAATARSRATATSSSPIRSPTTSRCRPRTRSSSANSRSSPRGRLPVRARRTRTRAAAREGSRLRTAPRESPRSALGSLDARRAALARRHRRLRSHPTPDFEVRWHRPFSIGIDTGAVYGGKLTAIRLPDETVFQV
jgi:hypothetical protein